jgi:hypothetical protein
VAFERFHDDEGQKPLQPIALLEGRTAENPVQLLAGRQISVGGRRGVGA